MDQGGKAGGQDDSSFLPSFSLKPSAAGAEPARLQPGQFVASAGFAERDSELVSDQFAATAGEDRRTAGQTCALLLATLGGRTSDAAALRGDAGSDRATAGTDGIDRRGPAQAAESVYIRTRQEGELLQKWRNIGQFRRCGVRRSEEHTSELQSLRHL